MLVASQAVVCCKSKLTILIVITMRDNTLLEGGNDMTWAKYAVLQQISQHHYCDGSIRWVQPSNILLISGAAQLPTNCRIEFAVSIPAL